MDCWGFFVRFTEHRKVKSSKNSVRNGIKHCIGKKCDKIFVKKSSFFTEKFNKIDVINLLISLYLEVLGLTSQCSQ
ncbi:hypothetical protein T06_9535 [Trichinella sp. T6]|nr:hypothetical protein T06_9535 [Trichinella sp. T6]